MKATVKRWVQTNGDIGGYYTTVTLYSTTVTTATTLPGKHSRKEALRKVFNHLAAEGRWSPAFLAEVRKLSD